MVFAGHQPVIPAVNTSNARSRDTATTISRRMGAMVRVIRSRLLRLGRLGERRERALPELVEVRAQDGEALRVDAVAPPGAVALVHDESDGTRRRYRTRRPRTSTSSGSARSRRSRGRPRRGSVTTRPRARAPRDVVGVGQERHCDVFTAGMTGLVAGISPDEEVVIEPREGGRWLAGSETSTGFVDTWEPPGAARARLADRPALRGGCQTRAW